ncbi:hypothetical protein SEA_NICOLETERA_40 [Mycobacterium phage NicoleTera]|nr:hypothetical protein SEA_NICOLETERA_40 [Mycobacterium phage NicoleTera]
MQIAFLELTDANNGSRGWVNVEQIASIVDLPDGGGTVVAGMFGSVTVAESADEVLAKVSDLVNRVNGE